MTRDDPTLSRIRPAPAWDRRGWPAPAIDGRAALGPGRFAQSVLEQVGTADNGSGFSTSRESILPYLASVYDSRLVILSFVVAILASYTTLNLVGRVALTEGRIARLWLLGGAAAMGIGIWSMHFIGMLSFSLPI